MAWVEQESPSLVQNQDSTGQKFQMPQELSLLVAGLYNQVVLVVIFQVGHCLEPNLSNPQVSPEVTHQVKEMEREFLMEREVAQEAQVKDLEE